MKNGYRAKEHLSSELAELRQRVMEVEPLQVERQKAEEARKQSEERFRLLFNSSNDAMFIFPLMDEGAPGNFIQVNRMACQKLGFTREELLKKSPVDIAGPQGRDIIHQMLKKLLEEKYTNYETVQVAKDSTIIPVENSSHLFRLRGRPAVLSITHDITERLQAGAEKKELEQKAQAARRLATIGELASGIAHEINNPLTGVIGFSQLLMQKDNIPDDIRKHLEIINDNSQRVADIVRRLLTFAHPEKPQREYVSISDIVSDSLAVRAYEMEVSNIKIITELDPDLPDTMADSGQLHQVFLNIIINAEKSMKMTYGKHNLWVRTEKVVNAIRISFKDDGIGIAKENLDKIFDPFFTTGDIGEGTGLGLSICLGIVSQHNGRIYAVSEPDKGVTFIVELPIVTKMESKPVRKAPVSQPKKSVQARILVVDDEPVVRQFLKQALISEGYDVEMVADTTKALALLNQKRYSLVLLDIKMPGMNGIELYKHISDIAHSLARRVIIITGDVMGEETREFLSQTKVPYITKPFDAEELKKKINYSLTQRV